MEINVNNKKIKISDEWLKNTMKTLDISKEEAVQMFLDDEGYTVNQEVEELTKKAKINKTDKIVVRSKAENKKTERKPRENPLKQAIIQDIYQFLAQNPTIYNVKIENKTKIISFMVENRNFKLDLVEKREKKDGK